MRLVQLVRRARLGVVVVVIASLSLAAIAVADQLQVDADGDTVAVSNSESLTLQPGATATRNVSFQLACGGGNNTQARQHVDKLQSVLVTSDQFTPNNGSITL